MTDAPKRPRGRPPGRVLSASVHVPIEPAEKAHAQAVAESRGVTVAELVRGLLRRARVKE